VPVVIDSDLLRQNGAIGSRPYRGLSSNPLANNSNVWENDLGRKQLYQTQRKKQEHENKEATIIPKSQYM
jgi:hypothetical protein